MRARTRCSRCRKRAATMSKSVSSGTARYPPEVASWVIRSPRASSTVTTSARAGAAQNTALATVRASPTTSPVRPAAGPGSGVPDSAIRSRYAEVRDSSAGHRHVQSGAQAGRRREDAHRVGLGSRRSRPSHRMLTGVPRIPFPSSSEGGSENEARGHRCATMSGGSIRCWIGLPCAACGRLRWERLARKAYPVRARHLACC